MKILKIFNKKITIRIIIIAVLILALSLYLFSFKLKPTKVYKSSSDLIQYSEEGFVDSMELNNTHKLVAANDNFELYLDETTSYFEVLDKRNGQLWQSNPKIEDPWAEDPNKNLTDPARNNQRATLQIQYATKDGTRIDLNNYAYSIYHPETIVAPEGERTFGIKYLDQGFQVLYIIKDTEIDHLYFPKYIDKDEFDEFPSLDKAYLTGHYNFERDLNAYYLPDNKYGDEMTRVLKQRLFDIFYHKDSTPKEEYGYDRDKVIEQNALYGYFDAFAPMEFKIAVQVNLTDDGFEASIVRNSLDEGNVYKLSSIGLYPLLGTAISTKDGAPTEGYLVIPDGSGAILDFNNGKENHSPYRKRLYGSDLALLSFKEPEKQESIRIPLYGMIKENGGFAAIITKGDAQTSLNADTSGRVDSYNKIYPTFHIRENELITLGTGYTTYSLNLWTQNIVNSDLTISYRLLEGTENNYIGVANAYRNYLIEEFDFQSVIEDVPNLMVEFIGAFDEKSFFLGIPYSKRGTMTTFNQALSIVNELNDLDLKLNVMYRGAMDGGMKNKIQTKAKIEKLLGGNKGYIKLEKELAKLSVNMYLQTNIARADSFKRIFDNYTYGANRLNGSQAKYFSYHSPSGLPYSETSYEHSEDPFVINPVYYQSIYDKFSKGLKTNNIADLDIGNILTGQYKKGNQHYKQDTLNLQVALLNSIKESMLFYNPLGFAYPYASYAVDIPTNTTQYPIFDDHIPLLQLVLSGYVPYSSRSMNLNNTRSEKYNFLKIIETGSNVKYTLSHDDPRKLINTEYNEFLATYYKHWIDTIKNQMDTLDGLKLYEGRLVNHQRMARDVYKVNYSNGLEVYVNYRLNNVVVDGVSIKSLDYTVTKEAS